MAEYSVKTTLKIQEYSGTFYANIEIPRQNEPPVHITVATGVTEEECLDNIPRELEAS